MASQFNFSGGPISGAAGQAAGMQFAQSRLRMREQEDEKKAVNAYRLTGQQAGGDSNRHAQLLTEAGYPDLAQKVQMQASQQTMADAKSKDSVFDYLGKRASMVQDQASWSGLRRDIVGMGLAGEQDFPEEYTPEVQQLVQKMAQTAGSMRQSNRGVQFLPTTEGYMVGDLASGGISKPQGGTFMPPQYSPGLQREIALQKERGKGQGELETAAPIAKAKEVGKTQGEKEAGKPKASLALENARQRSTRVTEAIDRAVPRVNYWTAGLAGAALDSLAGSPARDLRADIDTIRANIGFDELNAMRQSSPTGGALGQVSERELAFLQSVLTNLEQSQSPEQLRRNLGLAKQEIKDSWERVRKAYEADYGEGGKQPGTKPPSDTKPNIEDLLKKYGTSR